MQGNYNKLKFFWNLIEQVPFCGMELADKTGFDHQAKTKSTNKTVTDWANSNFNGYQGLSSDFTNINEN